MREKHKKIFLQKEDTDGKDMKIFKIVIHYRNGF